MPRHSLTWLESPGSLLLPAAGLRVCTADSELAPRADRQRVGAKIAIKIGGCRRIADRGLPARRHLVAMGSPLPVAPIVAPEGGPQEPAPRPCWARNLGHRASRPLLLLGNGTCRLYM